MYKTCGEEILQDLWRYHVRRNSWSTIKIDYHHIRYASHMAPSPRYGHAGCYIYTYSDQEKLGEIEVFERRFMYIFGGFSYDCKVACHDLWRYEIPYIPQAMTPPAMWRNHGNHWVQLANDADNGPGKRWKVSMVSY